MSSVPLRVDAASLLTAVLGPLEILSSDALRWRTVRLEPAALARAFDALDRARVRAYGQQLALSGFSAEGAQSCSASHIRPLASNPQVARARQAGKHRIAGLIDAPYLAPRSVPPPLGPRPCPVGPLFALRTAGHVAEVVSRVPTKFPTHGKSRRGTIGPWSPRSRRRMLRAVGALGLPRIQAARPGYRWLMFTMTYPDDPGAEAARRNRAVMRRRLVREARRRSPGADVVCIWKREFQARGVPHDHWLLLLPDATTRRGIALWRRWAWSAWWQVTGAAERPRVDLIPWRSKQGGPDLARYFVAYADAGRKAYQHVLPDGWESPGRWWGINGARPAWSLRPLPYPQFVQLRRVLRRVYKARCGRAVRTWGLTGLWLVSSGESLPAAMLALACGPSPPGAQGPNPTEDTGRLGTRRRAGTGTIVPRGKPGENSSSFPR